MEIRPLGASKNQNFGYSFRVNICIKDGKTLENVFVNPSKDTKLYKNLNSKIVGWLNEEYYGKLRKYLGITKKTNSAQPEGDIHKELIDKLKEIDSDYAKLNYVRSVYPKDKLGYIVTGADVPILENIKGAKHIGTAKADSKFTYGSTRTNYVRNLSQIIKGNMLNFAQSDDILLRSKNDKEIMLRAIFKKNDKKGLPAYELDSFEFHENTSLPTLKPVNQALENYKNSSEILNEIRQMVQHQINRIKGVKSHNLW